MPNAISTALVGVHTLTQLLALGYSPAVHGCWYQSIQTSSHPSAPHQLQPTRIFVYICLQKSADGAWYAGKQVEKEFTELDADGDGKVTRAEWIAKYGSDAGWDQVHPTPQNAPSRMHTTPYRAPHTLLNAPGIC